MFITRKEKRINSFSEREVLQRCKILNNNDETTLKDRDIHTHSVCMLIMSSIIDSRQK